MCNNMTETNFQEITDRCIINIYSQWIHSDSFHSSQKTFIRTHRMDFTTNFWGSLLDFWKILFQIPFFLWNSPIHINSATELGLRARWWKWKSRFLCAFCTHIFDGASMLAYLPELREKETLYNRDESAFKSHQVGWLWFCSMSPCSLGLIIQVLWSPFPHLRSKRFDPAHLQGPFPPLL